MYGAKWPILFLCFLTACAQDIEQGGGPEYPDDIAATFGFREYGALESVCRLWTDQLHDSIAKLKQLKDARATVNQTFFEVSDRQNPNDVDLVGPDQEISEWEVRPPPSFYPGLW